LALPSRPGGEGGEQAQHWDIGPGRWQRQQQQQKEEEGLWQPTASRSTHAAAAMAGGGRGGPRGDKHPYQLSNSDDGRTKCSVHNSTGHTVSECREIKKLTKQFRDKMQQQRQDGVPSHQREGKQKLDPL
jgi:hypothetical protein